MKRTTKSSGIPVFKQVTTHVYYPILGGGSMNLTEFTFTVLSIYRIYRVVFQKTVGSEGHTGIIKLYTY